jgi:hypothetical protein
MRHRRLLAHIKKVHAIMKPFTSQQRRRIAWQILLNETLRKDEEGLKWLRNHYERFVKYNKGDFK